MKRRVGIRLLSLAGLCLGCTLQGCVTLLEGPVSKVEHVEQVRPTGVRFRDILTGVGRRVRVTDRITMNYTAKIHGDGKVDSTYDRGEPVTILLSASPVLGWMDGIPGMREGGKRWILVPPHRAFGDEGVEGLIPPGATLEFLVELISLERVR